MYSHQDVQGNTINLPLGKVVCVGQNYHDHIAEMGSVVNEDAVLFMKPNTAVCAMLADIRIPKNQGECHNEVEVAVLIKDKLTGADTKQAMDAVWGYGLGLDLTLRNVQKQLKQLGRPWERAKAFDGSAPISPFIDKASVENVTNIDFSLTVNNTIRQQGNTQLMIRDIASLVSLISQHFTLLPGDIVLTGTPAGVAPLYAGDKLELTIEQQRFSTQVAHD